MRSRSGMERGLKLILSLGLNYPILQDNNLEMPRLVILAAEECGLKNLINLFSIGNAPRISERMNAKQVAQILTENNSVFAIYVYSNSRKGWDFLWFLEAVVRTGEIDGKKLGVMPVVISEGIPDGCNLEYFFTVFFEGNLDGIEVDLMSVVPKDNYLSVVEDKICSIVSSRHSQEERALLSAACFLYPNIMNGGQEEFEKIIWQVRLIIRQNDENQDTNNLDSAFVAELYRWQEKTNFYDVFQLPNLDADAVEKMNSAIFYDDRYLFIREKTFKQFGEMSRGK